MIVENIQSQVDLIWKTYALERIRQEIVIRLPLPPYRIVLNLVVYYKNRERVALNRERKPDKITNPIQKMAFHEVSSRFLIEDHVFNRVSLKLAYCDDRTL